MAGPIAIRRGSVYYVADDAIKLVPDEGNRQQHDRRPVLVVSGDRTNADPAWPIVLIMPISTSAKKATEHCVALATGEGGVSKDCWVRTTAIQPIEKRLIQDMLGRLLANKLEIVDAKLANYMDALQ